MLCMLFKIGAGYKASGESNEVIEEVKFKDGIAVMKLNDEVAACIHLPVSYNLC